jgi:glutamate/tyrosine decarboxylase-like PLP-dependent enzyme
VRRVAKGLSEFAGPPAIYVSKESHLAWLKMAHAAGIGRAAVRLISTDGRGQMDMQRIKGRSSRRIQMEYPELRKRYWGRRFWARGYFSTTSGNVTDDIILQYLELHSKRDATGVSR